MRSSYNKNVVTWPRGPAASRPGVKCARLRGSGHVEAETTAGEKKIECPVCSCDEWFPPGIQQVLYSPLEFFWAFF